MECYKEFAKIYDKLIYGDVNYENWANYIIKICDEYGVNKDSYLDLACGTGNMTKEIAKYFKHTWAVDLSYDMLTEAEDKLRGCKIKAKFVCQDISDLDLKSKFDLVTCILDSTNYILDTEKLKNYFVSVYKHLNDKGIFIFDINSYVVKICIFFAKYSLFEITLVSSKVFRSSNVCCLSLSENVIK